MPNDDNPLKPPEKQLAVAITHDVETNAIPEITASGRGFIAETILRLAFENDVKVREDETLAKMLTDIDIDSPIPSEAFMAVAEILSYVYRADGKPNPFDAVLSHDKD